jgi:hypothetical protein
VSEEVANDDLESTENEEVEETEDTEEESEETEKTESESDDKVQKRISDLQAKADKAEARANKLEKALAAAGKGGDAGSNDPARDALMQELREASLDAVYGEYPDLKKFGIDRSLVDGSTRAEMRESATSIVALIKSVATRARNDTLAEHGLKAEPAGSTRQKPVDYASMKDEDFKKLLDSL